MCLTTTPSIIPSFYRHNSTGGTLVSHPFCFQAAWLTHWSFEKFQKENRDSHIQLPSALEGFTHKLKSWNKDIFGNIFKRKWRIQRRLEGIQKHLSEEPTAGLLKLEARLKRHWNEALIQKKILWKQKSRADWLRLGDRNTQFFHTTNLLRHRWNKVEALQDDQGEWIFDQESLRSMAPNFFKGFLTSDSKDRGDFIRG